MTENASRREYPGPELGCFYSGTVDGDPYSAVTVSLCHGMVSQSRIIIFIMIILISLYFLLAAIRITYFKYLLDHRASYGCDILYFGDLI